LVLAARLTEDPSVSVGVIEAGVFYCGHNFEQQSLNHHTDGCDFSGQDRLADPNLLVPGCKRSNLCRIAHLTCAVDLNAIGKPAYDWNFASTPQVCEESSSLYAI
jgi:hypothetical protein